MRPGAWWLLGAAGLTLMVVASAWAPVQPELIDTGAACQAAPCGTLEDPVRWHRAWWVWSAGALLAGIASAFVLPPRAPDRRSVLLLVAYGVLVAALTAVLALVLSVVTSVQGVATATVLPALAGFAVLASWMRAR